MFLGKASAKFHHLLGVIHCNDALRGAGHELGEGAFASTKVGDYHGREKA